ncbi:MAG: SdrD B-like domain-containing protein, partial [Crocosphaera sp.]
GVSGVEVQLQNPDGSPVLDGEGNPITTSTEADGSYQFTGLTPGEYKVTFSAPEGFEFTTPNVGTNDAVDSDADPSNGMTQTVVLESGEFNDTLDAGLIKLTPGIEIEKSTNGVDADTPDQAPEIGVGDTVTWTYEVTNTGNVSFDESEVVVTDDQEGIITNIVDQGDGDNILAPGETWIYQQTGIAQDLSTSTNIVIDFETDGAGNALPAGTIIDDEYQNLGVTISATKFGAMIFDSANPTGGDTDLATDSEGNILIISEDGDSSDPDDNAGGGVITFNLDNPIELNSINFVDIEETGGQVFTTDADGNVTITSIPAPGDGSLQTLNINDSDVVKIEVELAGSGAISGLDFDTIADGLYKNIGTVVADGLEDSDPSHYVNSEPVPQNPGIDIEKFTNGVDADTIAEAVEIIAGQTVTWTYEVTNTGDVTFSQNEVVVTDDQEGIITNIINQGDGDNFLAPDETWIYEATGIAQDLTTTTSSENIRFHLTGNSYTTGHYGNVRTFTQNGVSVDVSAFSFNAHEGWKTAYLGAYGGGLGVTNRNESGSLHRVDNAGSVDYILFEFDEEVTVDRALLSYIDYDSDISVWIGDRNGDISLLNRDILNNFTKEDNNGGNGGTDYKRWANFNADELTGDTLVISAREDHTKDAFKLKKLDISVPGETTIGNYVNIGTVTAGSVSDEDQSGYTNPEGEPEPENPGINIEKFTNGLDADTLETAAVIAPHDTVTWTYEVTNTGDVAFNKADIHVTDDQEGAITHISDQGDGDNILAPGETWVYQETGIAQDLTTVTDGGTEIFNFTGNSGLDGPDGNIRTFSAGDVQVNASAFSRDEHGNWEEAFLGSFSTGLGVTDTSEGDGGNGLHRVDNVYRDNYVLFEFSEEVVVDSTFLDSVGDDSDITYWVGNKDNAFNDHNTLDDELLNSLEFSADNNGGSSSRWADINNGEVNGNLLVIAASISDHTPDDRFKIKELEVQQIGTVESDVYQNVGTVEVNGLTDQDLSFYVNPETVI